jgi:hypothetical protein
MKITTGPITALPMAHLVALEPGNLKITYITRIMITMGTLIATLQRLRTTYG